MSLHLFHKAVSNWFEKSFKTPTDVQVQAWDAIKSNQNTLIAAPTGSGKTLAAFLSAIDELIKQGLDGKLVQGTQIVYISPLKALSNDIERNLQVPIAGIKKELELLGLPEINIEVMVRTGDTSTAARTNMVKHPPHILVTTPESLYLLLTSQSGRKLLSPVHTIIIDEIHALVGDKRGSHLSLSVERLEKLVQRKLHRIGLSATQKPIEQVAKFLVGNSADNTPLLRRGAGGEVPTSTESTVPNLSAASVPPLPVRTDVHPGGPRRGVSREARRGEAQTSIESTSLNLPVQSNSLVSESEVEKIINCRIINAGHARKLDLSIEIPNSPLTSVMANEVWTEIYDRLINLIQSHETTLIFVNTRRLAERLSHNLNERLGPGFVLAHHGSMSKEQRFEAEQKLKGGNLKALVATASMELGIDVGSIDLVCQIGSSRSIAAFLQRVGRSGHSVNKTPKGKLFPLTCDELVECVAIMEAIRHGELDKIIMPEKPLDILAQQIVAEVACSDYDEDELFELATKPYPYRDLSRKEFDEVLVMLSEGFTSRRGRRGAYVHHDMINGKVKARKGARLMAITSGGAIPDTFDYDVMMEPENIFIGTLNEDFAIESIPGDIFQLGNNSWKILRVEAGKVRVEDAHGQSPNIPFWLGEAPGRTAELSQAVSRLRETISDKVGDLSNLQVNEEGEIINDEWKHDAVSWLVKDAGISVEAADQIVTYLASAKAALKIMPSQNNIVMERFFDEAGDMHLVIHSPFGSRLNKAWGLALRKRFCRKFNFELQAAANDDAIILSLGSTHSFPLEEVFSYLNPETVRNILIQALLDAPVFGVRWRWNASRALAIIRRQGNKRMPPQLQRMQSEDLVAQVFPDQLACLENIAGDREVPDHPLVNQTLYDCLHEAMDIDGLEDLLRKIKNKELNLVARDLKEPSPLAHEIVNAKPYAFLDDAPLEERRTQAVKSRRWISPAEANDLGKLDPEAIKAVKAEAWPEATNADELHDALLLSGFFTVEEGKENKWTVYFNELVSEGRATILQISDQHQLWVATERTPFIKKIYPDKLFLHPVSIPEKYLSLNENKDPLTEIVRGRLEIMGPVTAAQLAELMCLPTSEIDTALLRLENEGFVFRGHFSASGHPELVDSEASRFREGPAKVNTTEWCERRLLSRIHSYTIRKLRSEIQPVSAADLMRFLFSWHNLYPGTQPEGPTALEQVMQKLEGFEAPAAAWESDILPSRVKDYDYMWLDTLCISGKVAWGRFLPSASVSPIKTTPITFVGRNNLGAWKYFSTGNTTPATLSGDATKVMDVLKQYGASFFDDILKHTKLFASQAEDALGELISTSLVTSDSFTGLRALLVPGKYKTNAGSGRIGDDFTMSHAGRWSLLKNEEGQEENKQQNLETIAWALLRRYGVVFRKLAEYENLTPPWRDLVRQFRTMEARGQIRGGRFVEGVWGEQYALPEAITELRNIKKKGNDDRLVSISAADPLNLTGILTPGHRVSAFAGNRILFRNGVPIATLESKEVNFLNQPDDKEKWALQSALRQRTISPRLRKYLGKGVY